MGVLGLFNFLPILGPYRLTYYRSVVLRAPPTVLRVCVLFEVFITLAVFALSYYYTATTSTTETIIGFEAKGSPYSCTVLSPRSDSVSLSTENSELVAFSDARYTYTTCLDALGPDGYDLCSDEHRHDFLISVGGIGTGDDVCDDILLADGYRFCIGQEGEHVIESPPQFNVQRGPTFKYDKQYFMMNSNGNLSALGNPPGQRVVLHSDFVTDYESKVFVVASDGGLNPFLYQFDKTSAHPKPLISILTTNIYGITYGDHAIFVLTIEAARAVINVYNVSTGTTRSSSPINCNAQVGMASSNMRYLSYSNTNKLYLMCSSAVTNVGVTFYEVNPKTFATSTFTAFTLSLNSTDSNGASTSAKIDSISQIFRVDQNIYIISSKNDANILKANMQEPGNNGGNIRSITNLGYFPGSYAVLNTEEKAFYFPGNVNRNYYDIASSSFKTDYHLASRESYYLATYIQLGFDYQICDGKYTNYTIIPSSSTSFHSSCDATNGLFYQLNKFFPIGSDCAGYINSSADAALLLECPSIAAGRETFITTDCTSSYSTVCEAEFTENPPFSCERNVYPTFLTCIATALANASGAWSLLGIGIQLLLKLFYPHGSTDFDYDESVNRFLPLNTPGANYWHHAVTHPTSKVVPIDKETDEKRYEMVNRGENELDKQIYEKYDLEKGGNGNNLHQRKP